MDSCFDKFLKMVRPFDALWNSARVTCIAVGTAGERKCVAARFVLQEDELSGDQPFRKIHWLEPAAGVLIVAVDFQKHSASQILLKAIEEYRIDLETASTPERVFIRWPLPPPVTGGAQQARLSNFSWHDPSQFERPYARNRHGEDRTCLTIIGTGDYIHDVFPDGLRREVSSNLRRDPPHFDGIEDLFEKLLPGIGHEFSNSRVVEVVFPLPLDIQQTEDGMLSLRAPNRALEGQMKVVFHYKPSGSPTTIQVAPEGAMKLTERDGLEWRWPILWPRGAESGKSSLFYAGKEICNVSLRRWPGAGTLRVAVDSYFDPEHGRLKDALTGRAANKGEKVKASQTFEEATVRLMNLLGVPLIWYGGKWAQSSRNDAAGFVDTNEKRIVVLAECTIEKPEAKFSALQDRAQKLAASLRGEAEVLPVVFTQVDPAESAFETATDHGVALVGRNEINSLLDMLSATTKATNAISFLTQLKSRSPLGRMTLRAL